ncbi:MAG: DUF1189 family protein [Candidatus Omnitrophica bacterium]|nr:DUF1189 family protein [Candidatus Omnitrophota bacterium]
MTHFLLSPVTAFFSRRLYREALRSGIGRGFGFLTYLTLLFCIFVFLLCQIRIVPLTNSFVDWLIQTTPEMTMTSAGLTTQAEQPYLAKHPAFGPLYLIDTTKTAQELLATETPAVVLISKDAIILKQVRNGQTRVFNLDQAMAQVRQTNRPIQLTKQLMRQIANRILAFLVPLVLLFFAPFFFIWKLFAALFYSLFALLFNLFRKEKCSYRSLFVLSCFALAPVTVLQAINILLPNLTMNLNVLYAFVLTLAYLAFGLFVGDKVSSPSKQS